MTTIQVHLIMLALGILAFFVLAGIYSKRGIGGRRKPWLSILASIAIVLSPFSRLWREPLQARDLLTQSLLISAICLLVLLLVALLIIPFKALRRAKKKAGHRKAEEEHLEQSRAGLSPIMINAEAQDAALLAHDDQMHDESVVAGVVANDEEQMPVAMSRRAKAIENAERLTAEQRQLELQASEPAQASDVDTKRKYPANALMAEQTDTQPYTTETNALSDTENYQKTERIGDSLPTLKRDDESSSTTKPNVAGPGMYAGAPEVKVDPTAKRAPITTDRDQITSRSRVQPNISPVSNAAVQQQNTKTTTGPVITNTGEIIDAEPISPANSGVNADGLFANDGANNATDTATEKLAYKTVDNDDFDPLLSPASDPLMADDDNMLSVNNAGSNDDLDLSETEQLFAELRPQQTEVNLPDDREVFDATNSATLGTANFQNNVVSDQLSAVPDKQVISEATFIEEQTEDAQLSAKADEVAEPISFSEDMMPPSVPETLNDALLAAKNSAMSVKANVANLEKSITMLEAIRDEQVTEANQSIRDQQSAMSQRDALLTSEDEARKAAESVIAAQNSIIDQTKHEQAHAQALLHRERQRLQAMQTEIERSRLMARKAAQLARKAAVAQQEIRDVAKREQTARLKSQESTRKAVNIARNAITALAAEERKRGLTRH